MATLAKGTRGTCWKVTATTQVWSPSSVTTATETMMSTGTSKGSSCQGIRPGLSGRPRSSHGSEVAMNVRDHQGAPQPVLVGREVDRGAEPAAQPRPQAISAAG